MRIANDTIIEGAVTIENLPISNNSLSAIVQTDGNLFKRELGTISTASKESYIPGLSVSFPSIFNLNTESLDYNNPNLVVSLKNQLQGTAFLAPIAMNGTPQFRRILQSDLTDANVVFKSDNLFSRLALNGGIGGNSVIASDTRNINDEPSTSYRKGVFFDFKSNSVIGLTKPGVGTYSGTITMIPYSDDTGWNNTSFRIAHNAIGLNFQTWNGSWQNWKTIWDSSNLANGNTSQYIRGDGSLATFPTIPNGNDYVKKVGDKMSGTLLIKDRLSIWANNTLNNRESLLEFKRANTDTDYGSDIWADMRIVFNNELTIERKVRGVANNLLNISETGLITSTLHGTSANWKQAYDRGDFRDYGLGRYIYPAITLATLPNATGFYFVNETNDIFSGIRSKQAKVLRLGNPSFSAVVGSFILSHNGNEIGYRYSDTANVVRIWHSGNLTKLSQLEDDLRFKDSYVLYNNNDDLITPKYYSAKGSLDADTVLGNVAFYTSNNASNTLSYYHHQSWGMGAAYGYQIRKSPETSGGYAIRTRNNGNWLPWESIAYESWVNAQGFSKQTLVAGSNITITGSTISATNTTYAAGTLALLNTGTDTSNRVWPTKVLADYVTEKIAQGADSIWEHTPQGGLRIRNYDSLATRDGAIAITKGGGATKINAIGIGTSVNSDGNDGVVVGPLSANLGTYGTVVGPYSVNTPMEGVVIGPFLQNNQRGCTVTGRYNHPILNATTNTITDNSPLFIIGNGKSASIRTNAYVMTSDGKGEFENVQSYRTQPSSFNDLDIPNWKFIQENIASGGNGSEDYVSDYGSQISQFSETKANVSLSTAPLKASGEILGDQDIVGYTAPTLVYLGSDGKWYKWNSSGNGEYSNLTTTAGLGIAISSKEVLLRGYYYRTISVELTNLMNGPNLFHVINKGALTTSNSTSNVERVFGYKLKNNIGYFNPWMFK